MSKIKLLKTYYFTKASTSFLTGKMRWNIENEWIKNLSCKIQVLEVMKTRATNNENTV